MTIKNKKNNLTSLVGMSQDEIQNVVSSLGQKPFRAKQLWSWIYNKGVTSFDEMNNIGKPLQESLKEKYSLERPSISKALHSFDGTRKWLIAFEDGNEAETVHIPDAGRGSLCVSSQIGCTLTCKFCHTGTQRLVRNLTSQEIVGQLMLARDELNDWQEDLEKRKTSNIVMMGMGEPLLNFDNVAKALKIYMDPDGLCLSKRKITLSTSGVVPMIEQCGKELGVNLAISLHAVNNELRNELVPLNKKYPIEQLLAACRNYPATGNYRKITFEYVMLKDVNDSDQDARELVRLLQGIKAKVNLIPFNPWPGSVYECSSNERIKAFANIVQNAGYSSPVRTPRGQDILAACGQLKSESLNKKASKI